MQLKPGNALEQVEVDHQLLWMQIVQIGHVRQFLGLAQVTESHL